MTRKHTAILAIVLACIIGGATSPIFKWALPSVPPFTLGFFRFFIASIVLLPFVGKHLHIDKKSFTRLLLAAIISIPVQVGLYLTGLQYAPSINVPVISAAAPIFTIIGGILFLHEKKRVKIMVGTLIALGGVLFILISPILSDGFSGSAIGNLCFILATIAGICMLFILKSLYGRYTPMQLTFWLFFLGQLAMLPLMLWEMQSATYSFILNSQSIIGILYGGIVSAAASWGLYVYAVKYLPAGETGIFSYIEPFVTIMVAYPLLDEKVTSTYLLGAIFVFCGIVLAEGKLPHHWLHKVASGFKSII